MKNGICPKCDAREVYHRRGHADQNEVIMLSENILIPTRVAPDKYACASCGYLEYYIPYHDDLKLIREKWQQVMPKE